MQHIYNFFTHFLVRDITKNLKRSASGGRNVVNFRYRDYSRERCSCKASHRFQRAIRFASFYSLTLKRSCRVPVYIGDAADVPGWDSFRSIAQDLSHFASHTNLLITSFFLSFIRHGHFTLVSSRIERSTSPVLPIPFARNLLVLCCNRQPINRSNSPM